MRSARDSLLSPARSGAAPIVFLTPIRGRRNSNLDVALEARILFNERHPTNPFYWVNAKEPIMLEAILKRFEKADEVRTFEKGRFEVVHLGGMTIGRATYKPG